MSKDDVKPDWAMNKREKAAAERAAEGLPPVKRKRWPWLVGALVVVVGGGGWLLASGKLTEMQTARETAQQAAEQAAAEAAAKPILMQIAPYEATTVALGSLRETLKVTGSLAPVHQVSLSAEVSGRVLTVAAREGDYVTAGQVLATFDTEALTAALDQAKANAEATRVQLDQAQSDLDRTKSLVDRGLSAPTNLERAQSSLDQLVASLAAQETLVANAQLSLSHATVKAPFDGYISSRSADPGAFVGTGSPLFTVVDLTTLQVEATAPISYSPQFAAGQVVELNVEGFGDRNFEGVVDRLGPVAIEGSRMLPVYIALDNESGELRGGMFATGRIVLEEKPDGIGVPATALRQDSDGPFVLVVQDGIATRRAVTVARTWDSGAVLEIGEGLAPGDLVISESLPEIEAGMQIDLLSE